MARVVIRIRWSGVSLQEQALAFRLGDAGVSRQKVGRLLNVAFCERNHSFWRNLYEPNSNVRPAGLSTLAAYARRRAEARRRVIVCWCGQSQGPGQEGVPAFRFAWLKLVQGLRQVPC